MQELDAPAMQSIVTNVLAVLIGLKIAYWKPQWRFVIYEMRTNGCWQIFNG
jgi:hypothetical protein